MTYQKAREVFNESPDKLCREEKAVLKIISDIDNRRGIGDEWNDIDNDTQNEIYQAWLDIIVNL